MSDETTTTAKKPEKKARVRVLKTRLRIGNHHHSKGSETILSLDEYELRKKDGEIELISLV